MDWVTLLQRLLVVRDKERQALFEAYRPLDTAFFRLLREQARNLAEENSQESLRMTDVGLEAVEYAAEQEGVAQAWWARGNALLFLGRHDDCLAAYSTAISIFAGLDRAKEVAQLQTNCMPPLMWSGRYAEARAMGGAALEVLADEGDTKAVANLWLNLGVCALYRGDHGGALAQAERAAEIFTRLNDPVEAARCRVTQAWALECLDRFAEAEARLLDARQVFADQGVGVPWAKAALELGVLRARLADHQAALRWLEESRRGFLEARDEMDAATVDLYRAQCFLDLNLLPEAAMLGDELVETFTWLKMPREVAQAASLLAEVCVRRGQVDPARRHLERARQLFRTQGDMMEAAQIDLRRAALLREIGRAGEALRLASEAAETLDVHRYPLRHAEAHLIVAACCEDLGLIEEARVAYQVAWEAGSHPTGTTEPPPVLAYRIAHARGTIAEAAGSRPLARGEYGRAVGYLARIAQGLGLDELRGGYLANKRAVYESALRLALEDGRIADAFRYSELARAGALRDFLAHGRHSTPTVGGEGHVADSNALDTDLEELKARWAWRASGLQQAVESEASERFVEAQDQPGQMRELADLERKLMAAYRHRRLADPRFAILEQGDVLSLDDVRRRLPDDTALLSFDHVDDYLLAFVVTHDAAEVTPLGSLAELRWDAAGLGHALEEVRLFDDPADLAMLEADLLEGLQALYRAVLARPLARLGTEIRRLLVVPCDVLHTLPLEAFYDGRGYLLERHAVCYLPSASLLAALPEGRRAGDGSLLALAHSWEGRLSQATEEVIAITRMLRGHFSGEPCLLTEERATAKALGEHAGVAGLLHMAAHGAFREDAPLFSTLHLADGPFTVNEVYGLNLSQAALVTLSGCETGLGHGRGGEVLGLAHALFFAGAPTLAVSRWRVEDEATAQLMQDFYAALMRGETVAEALRQAQLSAMACRPHAGHWAAFAVWGRGFDTIFRGRRWRKNDLKHRSVE